MRSVLACSYLLFVPALCGAGTYRADPAKSVFAVVTNKAGFAAKFAHDHLITAPPDCATIHFNGNLQEIQCSLDIQADQLEIDGPAERDRWHNHLIDAGVVSQPLPPVSDTDRAKVRAAMLAPDQLDAANHPAIHAVVTAIHPTVARRGAFEFDYEVLLNITIRGMTASVPMLAAIRHTGNALEIVAVGEARFTEFGIKPYSAYLGAVRNEDRFFIFANIVAQPQSGTAKE